MKLLIPDDGLLKLTELVKTKKFPAEVTVKLTKDNLKVTVSKFGISTLEFDLCHSKPGWDTATLVKSKINWLHRIHIGAVKAAIVAMVYEVGGREI